MVGGALVLATAGIVGSVAVVCAGPAVAGGTITQNAPVKGLAPYGVPFRDQLQTSGNIGPVTFITQSATKWGRVSSTGAVSVSGTTPIGAYILFGTDADAFGDTGEWQYTFTVETVIIHQTVPTSGSVTTIGSGAFTEQLAMIGNLGPVTFTKTGGTASLKVSSGGKITTTGTLAMGYYKVTGTVADTFGDPGTFTYVLAVNAVTITQTAPSSGSVTVAGSAAFTDHLRTTRNIGQVTFTETGGGAGIKVSSHGRITTTGTLATGTYTATGTMSDAFGDTGYFSYTLTSGGPPITQTAPTSGSVTVPGSAAFTDHLRTTGNRGPVTFTKTGGTAGLKVSSGGKITTTGTLAVGTYDIVGTDSDAHFNTGTFTYVFIVKAVTITQTAPTAGSVTVAGSSAFTDQLNTTGNSGPVTFAKTDGGTGLKVSSRGQITTTGTLAIGNHTATGTVSDAFGDVGTFTYSLFVAGGPPLQATPTSGSVTVAGSVAFTDRLRAIGNIGPVTYTKTARGVGLKVSSRGQITTTGTLAIGTYTAFGTMSDAFGDVGTWVYTLTVKAVTITQTRPTVANSEAD
jgi:hypothetical protein